VVALLAKNLPGRHGSYEKDLEEIYGRAGSIDKGGVREIDNLVEGTLHLSCRRKTAIRCHLT